MIVGFLGLLLFLRALLTYSQTHSQTTRTPSSSLIGFRQITALLLSKYLNMETKSLKPLAVTFAIGGIWDTIAGFLYVFVIGTGRALDNPPMDPFYAIFLGSFFFCFAYLQILSSFNIRRYLFNVGCLIFGRLFYVLILYYFIFFVKGFPATFWFTGVIDGFLATLNIVFAFNGGLGMRDLFLPVKTDFN